MKTPVAWELTFPRLRNSPPTHEARLAKTGSARRACEVHPRPGVVRAARLPAGPSLYRDPRCGQKRTARIGAADGRAAGRGRNLRRGPRRCHPQRGKRGPSRLQMLRQHSAPGRLAPSWSGQHRRKRKLGRPGDRQRPQRDWSARCGSGHTYLRTTAAVLLVERTALIREGYCVCVASGRESSLTRCVQHHLRRRQATPRRGQERVALAR